MHIRDNQIRPPPTHLCRVDAKALLRVLVGVDVAHHQLVAAAPHRNHSVLREGWAEVGAMAHRWTLKAKLYQAP